MRRRQRLRKTRRLLPGLHTRAVMGRSASSPLPPAVQRSDYATAVTLMPAMLLPQLNESLLGIMLRALDVMPVLLCHGITNATSSSIISS